MQKSESETLRNQHPGSPGASSGATARKENYFLNSGPPPEVITVVLGILVALSEAVGYSLEANK